MRRRSRWLAPSATLLLLAAAACEDGGEADPLVQRGRSVYLSNCIACHNMDPSKDGPLGPAVAGSSEALLEARVVRGEYPPGYTPKRASNAMVPLPHLEPEIPALAAYLESLE